MSDQSQSVPGLNKSLKHDLRTPLNHIIGYREMLIKEAPDRGLGAVFSASNASTPRATSCSRW